MNQKDKPVFTIVTTIEI